MDHQPKQQLHVYELDGPDADDSVDGLTFPSTSITLSGCDHDGSLERRTSWVSASSSVISRADFWSVKISRNWRIVFRFDDNGVRISN